VLFVLALLLAGYLALVPGVRHTVYRGLYLLMIGHLGQFHDYLRSLGPWAAAVSTVLMVAQSVAIPIPVTLLMVANGLVFGIWYGMWISFLGALLGAIIAFHLGRRLGRRVAERVVPCAALDAADRLMARRGGWAIVFGRWVPGIPCDPFSYAAGIMKMPLRRFLLFTVVGLLPANLITAFVGAETTGDFKTSYWLLGVAAIVGILVLGRFIIRARQRKRREMAGSDAP